jgi:hypothetical protein
MAAGGEEERDQKEDRENDPDVILRARDEPEGSGRTDGSPAQIL